MNVRAILGILGTAAVSCALVLAIAGARNVDAVDDGANGAGVPGAKEEARAGWLEMDAGQCRLRLSVDKPEYQPGERPVLTLTAKNLSNRPLETAVQLQMLAVQIPSPLARVMPKPEAVWAEDCLVSLGAGEMKSVVIKAGAKLAAERLWTITAAVGDQKAQSGPLKVAGGAPQQAGNAAEAAPVLSSGGK